MFSDFGSDLCSVGCYFGQVLWLMVGLFDYDIYVVYMCEIYLDCELMMYEEFFCECQNVCYGLGVGKCC